MRSSAWADGACIAAGAALFLAFSPWSFPLVAVASVAVLFRAVLHASPRRAFWRGWLYGLAGVRGRDRVDRGELSVRRLSAFGTAANAHRAARVRGSRCTRRSSGGPAPGSWAQAPGDPMADHSGEGRVLVASRGRGSSSSGFGGRCSPGSPGSSSATRGSNHRSRRTRPSGAATRSASPSPPPRPASRSSGSARNRSVAVTLAVAALLWAGGYGARRPWMPVPGGRGRPGSRSGCSSCRGNVSQEDKWSAETRRETLERYARLTGERPGGPTLVVWPETAIPYFAAQVRPYLQAAGRDGRPGGLRAPHRHPVIRSGIGAAVQQRRPDCVAPVGGGPDLLSQASSRPVLGAPPVRDGDRTDRGVDRLPLERVRIGRGTPAPDSGRWPRDRGVHLLRDHVRRGRAPGISATPRCSSTSATTRGSERRRGPHQHFQMAPDAGRWSRAAGSFGRPIPASPPW